MLSQGEVEMSLSRMPRREAAMNFPFEDDELRDAHL